MTAFDGTHAPTLTIQVLDGIYWMSLPTADVRQVDVRRGRTDPFMTVDAGSMTVLLDDVSGDYDPDNASSPWYPLFRVATQAKLLATWQSTTYTLFTGWLESASVDHGFDPTVTLSFTDAVARISAIPTTAIADSLYDTQYDDERVDDRVTRLVSSGWLTFIESSSIAVAGRTLTPIRKGQNFTQILDECAVAQAGRWYVNRSGALVFVTSDDKFIRPTRLFLSDSRASNTVEYDMLRVSPGASLLVNDARVSRPAQNSNDEMYYFQYNDSVNGYGIKSREYSAPIYDGDWASTLAMYFSRIYALPLSYASRVEFSALALDAYASSTLFPDLLKCELNDLLTIERHTVDGRTLTWDVFIEGLDHSISPDSWTVGFDTSPTFGFYPKLGSDTPSTTHTETAVCPQVTLTPDPLQISSTTGFTYGTVIDRIKVTDSKDVQLEGQKELGAATGTLNLSLRQFQVFVCESNATANFTVNLRGTSSISLAKSLRKGDSVTCTLFVKNGSTAYYCSTVKVDGTTFTKGTNLTWAGGSAPTAGTKSGWDEYQFTVEKRTSGDLFVRASLVGAS